MDYGRGRRVGCVPHVSPRGITNYELSGVTFTNIRNRSQEFIMESDSRVALFVGAKQSSAKFCFSNLCLLSCNDLADL